MEPLGSFPRAHNVLRREKIEGPPRDFLRRTRGHIQGQTKGFGLAEDMAKSSPLENPEGGLQYSSDGVHWVLKGPPEGSIHHDTSEALPQIFILIT